jgi:hypothetical protein
MAEQATTWGYARRSTKYETQEECLPKQAEQIGEKFTDLVAKYGAAKGEIIGETKSGYKVPFNKRPGFVKLLSMMKKGDWLVVTDANRLDRGAFALHACCQKLYDMGINLCILRASGLGDNVELKGTQFLIYLAGVSIANALHKDSVVSGVLAKHAHLRKNHLPWKAYPDWGLKWATDPKTKTKSGSPKLIWVPDFDARATIEQIVRWHAMEGKTFWWIANEIHQRNLREPENPRWSLAGYAKWRHDNSRRRKWAPLELSSSVSSPKARLRCRTRNVIDAFWWFVEQVNAGVWWDQRIEDIRDDQILKVVSWIIENVSLEEKDRRRHKFIAKKNKQPPIWPDHAA